MILAVDVQYFENSAFVAGVVFDQWNSMTSVGEYVSTVNNIQDYEPGNFYKRELPCIIKMLNEHKLDPSIIVIDGYVFLDGKQKPGLGKRLFDSLSYRVEVVGVAKKAFSGISKEYELHRGKSKRPLYVTSTGKIETAKDWITKMYGANRIPVLLKRADQLCREAANKKIKLTP